MNELIPNFGFIAFLFAGCAFLIGLCLCSVQRSYRIQLNTLKGTLRQEQVTKKQMEEDFRALLVCSRNMGRRINETASTPEPTIRNISRAPLNLHTEQPEVSTGDKVHELVAHGLSVDEVASVCGLTRGEVDFLSRFFNAGDNKRIAVH